MIGDDEIEDVPVKRGGHALEKFLNIQPTPMEKVEAESKPLVKHDEYDKKDEELEEQIQDVYQKAMSGYLTLEQILADVEPKYRARLAEVALAYLNTSLNAVNSKAKHKEHKDKINIKQRAGDGGNKTTNIVFSGDRNEALRMAKRAMEQSEAIDGEVLEKDDTDSN